VFFYFWSFREKIRQAFQRSFFFIKFFCEKIGMFLPDASQISFFFGRIRVFFELFCIISKKTAKNDEKTRKIEKSQQHCYGFWWDL
jgi:hypothetical protein